MGVDMQRIFDIENEKDMEDLWDILPDDAYSIKKSMGCQTWRRKGENTGYYFEFVKINWHDKTEITRPIEYDNVIGCVGWFWDGEQKPARPVLSVLWRCDFDGFWTVRRELFEHFMTAKKSDLKFYGDEDD